jgi:hypothetical protein
MLRRTLLLSLLSAAPAWASVDPRALAAASASLPQPLLSRALKAWSAAPGVRLDLLAVVDFNAASTAPRLHLIDLLSGKVESHLTAHGRGSDPEHTGFARTFSNEANSHASSLGAYRTDKSYVGKHGLSLRLDGLDATNSNARDRAIVLHSAPYMTADHIRAHKRPGRSWGCFVVEPRLIETVIARLEGGVLIYAGL